MSPAGAAPGGERAGDEGGRQNYNFANFKHTQLFLSQFRLVFDLANVVHKVANKVSDVGN